MAPPVAPAPASPTAFDMSPPRPLVSGFLAEAGALLSGVLYFLSFAGFDRWWLAFIALSPLYLALQGQTPRRAAWLGFLCGLAMNVGGFYWLMNMLTTFSGFPTFVCLLLLLIICSYQGSRLTFMAWLYARAVTRGWPGSVVFAGAFVASELLFPVLFPWFYAGSVHQVPILTQSAEVAGPILVGLVIVLVNMAAIEPLRARLAKENPRRGLMLTAAAALAANATFGAVRIRSMERTIEAAPSARAGLVQGNMGLLQKRENPSDGLRRHVTLTQSLQGKGVDFAVWSESSVTFAVPEELAINGHFYRDRFASKLGLPTIFGGVLFRADPDRERWFNTAIATDIHGEVTGRYDKQYLLAFGEYLPLGEAFPILYAWSPHSGRFTPGTAIEPVTLTVHGEDHKVSVLICYEDILPAFTNSAVSHGKPDLLVNITNDAWFGDTTEPWQHLALAKFRAIEHRRFLVRATNTGVSAIVDPIGRIVIQTKTFVADAQEGLIRWLHGTTVYEVIGDVPWWLVSIAMAIAAFVKRDTLFRRRAAKGSAANG